MIILHPVVVALFVHITVCAPVRAAIRLVLTRHTLVQSFAGAAALAVNRYLALCVTFANTDGRLVA
jgi:hypothetical protein